MELVVHADDLACSVGLPTPEFPEEVTAPVVELLARLAVWRHGTAGGILGLGLTERVSWSNVESQRGPNTTPPPSQGPCAHGRGTGD